MLIDTSISKMRAQEETDCFFWFNHTRIQPIQTIATHILCAF